MEKKIKKSVGILLAHIIKVDGRDIGKEAALFCTLMGQNFDCNHEEAEAFLKSLIETDYDLDEHVNIINQALCDDKLSKLHLLEQINHMIYSDNIAPDDYKVFEDIKNKLFEC